MQVELKASDINNKTHYVQVNFESFMKELFCFEQLISNGPHNEAYSMNGMLQRALLKSIVKNEDRKSNLVMISICIGNQLSDEEAAHLALKETWWSKIKNWFWIKLDK